MRTRFGLYCLGKKGKGALAHKLESKVGQIATFDPDSLKNVQARNFRNLIPASPRIEQPTFQDSLIDVKIIFCFTLKP